MRAAYSQLSVVPNVPLSYAPELMAYTEVPLLDSANLERLRNGTVPSGLKKTNPSFHLLIPATQSNVNLCKTLLSSFVLSYPSPTLVNYGKVFNEEGWDNGTHIGKIQGTYNYLKSGKDIKDDDLVLIIDGYDVWFQLPPEVMIKRYHKMMAEADERLRTRFGMAFTKKPGKGGSKVPTQKYTQKVLFAADKICWPNPADDPACAAIPYSTLPKDTYGPNTDTDPKAFRNRPRFLNSGTIIGRVADVRAVYEQAIHKVEEKRGTIGDQFVFAEIFGEQEYQREVSKQSTRGAGGRWLDWISSAVGTSESPLSANRTINNMTVMPGRNYEFGIGLDYESAMFQTMTHADRDVEFISYNDSSTMSHIDEKYPSLRSHPTWLPLDIQQASPPFTYSSPGNHSEDREDTILLPYSKNLDTISKEPTWPEVPLATNVYAASIPALLHFNGDKSPLSSWWSQMWFSSNPRALLRRYIRSTQSKEAAYAAATGGHTWWDTRGGRGGVWTDIETWMEWGQVCKKTEDQVFADGKGRWAKEEGRGKVVNSFGKVLQGDDDDED